MYIISDFGMRLHRFGQNITKAYELKNATEEDEKISFSGVNFTVDLD